MENSFCLKAFKKYFLIAVLTVDDQVMVLVVRQDGARNGVHLKGFLSWTYYCISSKPFFISVERHVQTFLLATVTSIDTIFCNLFTVMIASFHKITAVGKDL